MSVIKRPETVYDDASHTYTLNGEKLAGVSSIAKMGEALDAFSVGSAWGWRVGYEGVYDLTYSDYDSKEQLREALVAEGLAPWSSRDRAADRGTWVHDILEKLADGVDHQDALTNILLQRDLERNGHAKALLQWYLDYRPEFVATEVQVTSEEHGFAGRYDIRCKIQTERLVPLLKNDPEWSIGINWDLPKVREGSLLCLIDLKTSKRIYPLSNYAQLEGYELASVEMGFPPTDLRLVLNTKADGTYEVGVSYATGEEFLAYLGAYKAIKRLQALDPVEVAKREAEAACLALLPAYSKNIAGEPGCPATSREVGMVLGRLRKRGLVEQVGGRWQKLEA